MQPTVNTKPTKIGEGTYGCVFKPSMNCKIGTPMPQGFNNNDYISKFMKNYYAQEELDRFTKFNKIDPNDEYHLGHQLMCDPEINFETTQQISTCENIDLKDVASNPSNYKLLIGKYGGPDLKDFCDKFAESYFIANQTAKEQKHKKDKFLFEILHLLKGLKFFKENGLVHYDLKPHNILFNLNDGSMKFIDFGLMQEKNKIKDESRINRNWLGSFHWSYPLDIGFINKNDFELIKQLTSKNIDDIINETYEQISSGNTNKTSIYPIKKPSSFLYMYTNYLQIKNKDELYSLLLDFKEFFKFATNNSYDTVLDKTIDFIDIYGLGITLKYLVNCLFNYNVLDTTEVNQLNQFFNSMVHFDPHKRNTNIDELINTYSELLYKLGAKSKGNVPRCGSRKEFNPRTGRCVKKCLPGYIRDAKFKCRKPPRSVTIKNKNKTTPTSLNIYPSPSIYASSYVSPNINSAFIPINLTKRLSKQLSNFLIRCGPDEELDPITKQCIKKCPLGQKRDKTGQCVKTKKYRRKM